MASGVQELLCSERIALLAHQEFVHAACSGRAKILYEMASHDCGKRFSRFAFDNRSRRRFPLAGWLKALPGSRPGVPAAQHSGGCFEDFKYHRVLDGENAALEFSAHIGDVELKAVHLIRFNAAGEFVEIEKLVRPAEGVKALGNAMAALIGPQVKALRAAA